MLIQEHEQHCVKNKSILNPKKSKYIQFFKINNVPDRSIPVLIKIFGSTVQRINETFFLGFAIHENLIWTSHVYFICKKLNSTNFVLYSFKNKVSLSALLMVYFGYMFSYLNLNIVYWGVECEDINRIFKLQKRPVKTLKNLKPLDTCKSSFNEFNLLTVFPVFLFLIVLCIRERTQILIF
jgi:hypothetical protein